MNYFELFALPERFTVDMQRLAERYRELQRTFHPDRFASASALERRRAMQHAAEINQAFHTLKDPVERARYLLSLRGVENPREAAPVDHTFLLEQMELRERLEEVRGSPDPFSALDQLADDIRRRIRLLLDELAERLEEGDRESLQAAGESLAKLMFLRKVESEADEIHDELMDE